MKPLFEMKIIDEEVVFVCTNHDKAMTQEEANVAMEKGVVGNWSEGIFTPVIRCKSIVKRKKIETYDDKKKRLVRRTYVLIIMCSNCGRFEEREVQNMEVDV